jgi:hypothetical protein
MSKHSNKLKVNYYCSGEHIQDEKAVLEIV